MLPSLPDTGNETDLSAWLGSSPLDTESLTDRQFWLAGWCAVKGYPRILKDRSETRVAMNLERLGWGAVEEGASGERIFRLSQAGEDAFEWLRKWQNVDADHAAPCTLRARASDLGMAA